MNRVSKSLYGAVAAALTLSLVAVGAPAQAATLSLAGSQAPARVAADAAAPKVLIIGDSTTVHMLAIFKAELAARGLDATIDAKSGRTVRQGRAVLAGYDVNAYDYVAVLLGANGVRANSLIDFKALRRAGVDTVATVQAPAQRTVNSAITAVFGSKRIPWAGYAIKQHIATFDGKHYRVDQYRIRARYLASGIAARAVKAKG